MLGPMGVKCAPQKTIYYYHRLGYSVPIDALQVITSYMRNLKYEIHG